MTKKSYKLFIDLKSGLTWAHNPPSPHKEMAHELWTNHIFTVDGLPSRLRVSSVCPTIQRRLQGEKLFMLGSVSLHGIRTTYLSGKSARYPSVLTSSSKQTLSHGLSRENIPQHTGQRQSSQELADLRRLCSRSHRYRQTTLCKRRFWSGTGTDGIRIRFHDNRSMPFSVSVGHFPKTKGRCEDAYSVGPAREHSLYDLYNSWEGSRRKDSRQPIVRTRRNLCDGSGLSGFCSSSQNPSGFGILRHSRQDKLRFQTPLLSRGEQVLWSTVRSECGPYGLLLKKRLSREAEAHSLPRSKERQAPYLLDQQLHSSSSDNSRSLSVPLASRIVFQVDKAAPKDKSILWYITERGKSANLDRNLGLRPCVNSQETHETGI